MAPQKAVHDAGSGAPRPPASQKHLPQAKAKSAMKAVIPFLAMSSSKTLEPTSPLNRSASTLKADPLELNYPPQGMEITMQPPVEVDYLSADMNPDSLLADIEALLAQERMLSEQCTWWQERARREGEAQKAAEAEVQNQEMVAKREIEELRRRIAETKQARARDDEKRKLLAKEASAIRMEANESLQQAEQLRQKLEELAQSSPPHDSAKIRSCINHALFANRVPKSLRKGISDKTSNGSLPNSARSRARSGSPRSEPRAEDSISQQPWNSARSMAKDASRSSQGQGSGVTPRSGQSKAMAGWSGLPGTDIGQDKQFGGGPSKGGMGMGIPMNVGGGGGGLGDFNFDEDDDEFDGILG